MKMSTGSLVLDRHILQASYSSTPFGGDCLTDHVCAMEQATVDLAEAVLARSLVFQLRDVSVDLGGWTKRGPGHPTTLDCLALTGTWRFMLSLRAIETARSRRMKVLQASKSLVFRSTSVADDETLCLGNLLGIYPDKVVRAESRREIHG